MQLFLSFNIFNINANAYKYLTGKHKIQTKPTEEEQERQAQVKYYMYTKWL